MAVAMRSDRGLTESRRKRGSISLRHGIAQGYGHRGDGSRAVDYGAIGT
jgi:hypothetical protein